MSPLARSYAYFFARRPHAEPRDLLLSAITRSNDKLLAGFGRTTTSTQGA